MTNPPSLPDRLVRTNIAYGCLIINVHFETGTKLTLVIPQGDILSFALVFLDQKREFCRLCMTVFHKTRPKSIRILGKYVQLKSLYWFLSAKPFGVNFHIDVMQIAANPEGDYYILRNYSDNLVKKHTEFDAYAVSESEVRDFSPRLKEFTLTGTYVESNVETCYFRYGIKDGGLYIFFEGQNNKWHIGYPLWSLVLFGYNLSSLEIDGVDSLCTYYRNSHVTFLLSPTYRNGVWTAWLTDHTYHRHCLMNIGYTTTFTKILVKWTGVVYAFKIYSLPIKYSLDPHEDVFYFHDYHFNYYHAKVFGVRGDIALFKFESADNPNIVTKYNIDYSKDISPVVSTDKPYIENQTGIFYQNSLYIPSGINWRVNLGDGKFTRYHRLPFLIISYWFRIPSYHQILTTNLFNIHFYDGRMRVYYGDYFTGPQVTLDQLYNITIYIKNHYNGCNIYIACNGNWFANFNKGGYVEYFVFNGEQRISDLRISAEPLPELVEVPSSPNTLLQPDYR